MSKQVNRRKDSLNSATLSHSSINDLSKLAMKNIQSYDDDFEISQSESSALNQSLLFDQKANEIAKNPRKHRASLPKLRTNLKEKPTKQPYKLKIYSVFFN